MNREPFRSRSRIIPQSFPEPFRFRSGSRARSRAVRALETGDRRKNFFTYVSRQA